MSSYRIWKDRDTNRIHLVLKPELTEEDVLFLSQQLQAIARKLKPGFSINITNELDGTLPRFMEHDSKNSVSPVGYRNFQIHRIIDSLIAGVRP